MSSKILAGDIPSADIFNRFLSRRGSEKISYTWNPDGTPATATDTIFGYTYTYAYDAEGDFLSITDGTNTWTAVWGSDGNLSSIVES